MLERAPGSPRSSRGQIGATTDDRRARVVIVGGGIAGVEGLLGLHELAGDRVDLTLISPEPELTYKRRGESPSWSRPGRAGHCRSTSWRCSPSGVLESSSRT